MTDPPNAASTTLAVAESVAGGASLGASVAFAFLFAPVAARSVADLDEFATLVERTIGRTTRFATVCGSIAFASALGRAALGPAARARHVARAVASLAAVGLLGYHERAVVPAMAEARRELGGPFAAVPADAPARLRYRALHRRSTRVYGAALLSAFAGLVDSIAER